MKTIDSFDTLLHYVNRLGFAGSGSIQIPQDSLCCVCDAIMASAGAILGPEGKGFPFKVRFHNHVASNGFRYPSVMARKASDIGTSCFPATSTTSPMCMQGSLWAQLPKLEKFWVERQRLWEQYDALLAGLPEVIRPVIRPEVQSAYHLYNIRVKVEELLWSRDQIMGAIQAENIGLGVHFRALHLHPYYQERFGFQRGLCPVAEAASDRLFSLPLYPGLVRSDLRDVVLAVTKVLSVARQHPFRSVAEGCSAPMMP